MVVAAMMSMVLVTGCKKNSTGPVLDASTNSNQDAAQSIANAVGEDNGGMTDQMGDIADATGSAGISANVGSSWTEDVLMKATTAVGDTISKTFNVTDTSWTVFVSRSRIGLLGRAAEFTRSYYIKFIDPNGVALPRYITTSPADTASTIVFKVLNGTGHITTTRLSTHLLSISSDFLVTRVDSTTMMANGAFTRTGTDTISTLAGMRVLNYTLSANLQNVTGPRIPRYLTSQRLPRATGGSMTGTYTATVSVLRGDSYSERSFTKAFTVTFGNAGGSIDLHNGSSYQCNITYGELSGN